ncbi:MAG TPA: MMPL family transporter [Methanomassiliicoccales archaeon]|nr:MMPL family transporter [Methanomassiliicoccales archaeon]
MVFDRLANKVTKHYKLIIVIWVVLLLLSVPAMMSLDSVVSYDSEMTSEDQNESTIAANIIADNFQGSVANSTLIIVLQSDDMTTAEARDFVLELQNELASADLAYMEDIGSIYAYSGTVLYMAINELGPQMYMAEEQVNQSAFLFWGVPAMHAQAWAGYFDSDMNETNASAYAYSATTAALNMYASQMDANMSAMVFGYYAAFANAWNATALNSTLVSDPVERGEFCVNAVAPTFISNLPLDAVYQQVMMAVVGGFNMTTFSSQPAMQAFTLGMISNMAGISNVTFLQEVYDLGPNYSNLTTQIGIASLIAEIITTNTLDTYPIPLPDQLITGFVSPDNQTMMMTISFSVSAGYMTDDGETPMTAMVDDIREIIMDVKGDTGFEVTTYVTGAAAISKDMEEQSASDMALIEPITIIVILVLMGYLFRTVVGQFLPLGAVGVAIGISQAMVFVLASTVMDVNYMVSTLLFALLMGVGTDYSIFIVTRYREERMRGADREKAVHTALTWAGESVATSASTVIIAFLAMATADFSFVQSLGVIIALAIIIALMVALTLIPSILMLVGNRIFWPTTGKRWENYRDKFMARKAAGNHGYFHQAASFSVKHAKVVLIVAVLVTVPSTYMFVTAETSFDFIGAMGDSESIDGIKAMTDDFGAGSIQPTQIVITGDVVVYDGSTFNYAYLDAIENITAVVASESEVQKVTGITRPYGEPVDYRNLDALDEETRDQVVSAMLSNLGADNRSVLLTVILADQPQSAGSVAFISELRGDLADVKAAEPQLAGSDIYVGGVTAALYDTAEFTDSEFRNVEILVVIGIFIVLMIVLGSVLLPAFAVITIAMSISWAFALTYLVFGTILSLPVLWLIPLILFVMLMGIGIDYNIFILTRIREEIHKGKETKEAVVDAVDWTGGIITALALIMAGAFGAMMLSSNAMLQEFGFALTVAILLDAMVVRTYIVPAGLAVMGKKAWWAPGRLQREGREEKMRKRSEKKQ